MKKFRHKNFFKIISLVIAQVITTSCKTLASGGSELLGVDVGQGGDVVRCTKPFDSMGGKDIVLLDLYESLALYHLPPWNFEQVSSGEPEYLAKALNAISQIKEFDQERYDRYRDWLLKFVDGGEMKLEENLSIDVPDSGSPAGLPAKVLGPGEDPNNLPPGEVRCWIDQLAYQMQVTTGVHYRIKKELWDRLNSDSQAATALHEIIYREFRPLGHENSLEVRHFVALLASKQVKKMSEKEYFEFIRDVMGIPPVVKMDGTTIDGTSIKRDTDGSIASATPIFFPMKIHLGDDVRDVFGSLVWHPKMKHLLGIFSDTDPKDLETIPNLAFYKSGKLRKIESNRFGLVHDKEMFEQMPIWKNAPLSKDELGYSFLLRGKPEGISTETWAEEACAKGLAYIPGADLDLNSIEYYESGNVKSIVLSGKEHYVTCRYDCENMKSISFADDGRVDSIDGRWENITIDSKSFRSNDACGPFYPNGQVKNAKFMTYPEGGRIELRGTDGAFHEFRDEAVIEFDENGSVTSW
ncbi:MAG: hypothetical protein AB7T49_19120 [Oligoflexales bacterium]